MKLNMTQLFHRQGEILLSIEAFLLFRNDVKIRRFVRDEIVGVKVTFRLRPLVHILCELRTGYGGTGGYGRVRAARKQL